jgi:hypothetical protein
MPIVVRGGDEAHLARCCAGAAERRRHAPTSRSSPPTVERSDICAVAAAGVVLENDGGVRPWQDAALEKFGGDTMSEVLSAHRAFLVAARAISSR